LLEAAPDGIQQLFPGEGFGNVAMRQRFRRDPAAGLRSEARHVEHRHTRPETADGVTQLGAIEEWHPEIGNHQVGSESRSGQKVVGRLSMLDINYSEPFSLEHPGHGAPNQRLILDQKNERPVRGGGTPTVSCPDVALGGIRALHHVNSWHQRMVEVKIRSTTA
jgi:hypothetical protein